MTPIKTVPNPSDSLEAKSGGPHTNQTELPQPADFPQADVVIYDGDCRICTRQVRSLSRWDRGHRLTFLSLHDPLVAQIAPELTHEQLMEQMHIVRRDGTRYGGAVAVRYLTRRLPRLWILAPVLHIPGTLPLWQMLYRWIARQRYRWNRQACADDKCEIHFKK